MARHRVFYASLEEMEKAAKWIEENLIGVDNVEVHEAYDNADDEVSFTTSRRLDDLGQSVVVYRTGACLYSFNGDDY